MSLLDGSRRLDLDNALFLFTYLLKMFITLKGKEADRWRDRSSVVKFTPQMPTAVRAGPGLGQEPGTPSESPT